MGPPNLGGPHGGRGQSISAPVEDLLDQPDHQELARLDGDMLGFFDQVLDAVDRSRGQNRRRLLALGQKFERAAEGFEQARQGLARAGIPD